MAEPSRLRVGVVGAGLMGRWHATAAARCGGVVAAVLDDRPAAAHRLARAHRAVAFGDLDRMVSEADLDVLHICTPLGSHADLTHRALSAGWHVLCEKPLTPDAEATAALLATADAHARLVCPVHQFPFQDGVRDALRWLPTLGKLVGVEAVFHSAGAGARHDPAGQALADAVVADVLPHPLSLMQVLLPDGTSCDGWHVVHPSAGEFTAVGVQRETTVSIRISMGARPTTAALHLYGTAGSVSLDLFHGYAVAFPGAVSRARKVAGPFTASGRTLAAALGNMGGRIARWEPAYPGLRALVRRFYAAAAGRGAAPFTPAQILDVARVRDRLVAEAGLLSSP